LSGKRGIKSKSQGRPTTLPLKEEENNGKVEFCNFKKRVITNT
jgi:hypothetical protein